KRVEVTKSCRPKVIWVGAFIRASYAKASWAMTALDWRRKASSGCFGRPRTNAASWSMYSGLAEYSSGVKHQGKMPWMIISVTLPRPLAIVCQPSTTALRNGTFLVHPLCRDSDFTRWGYLAASHNPVAAPSDRPLI